MNYKFQGNLLGYLCNDCYEYLDGVIIRLYNAEQTDRLVERAVADVKETFHQLTEEEVRAKSNHLFGEAVVDEKGNFSIDLPANYNGAAFDIDFECGNVPHRLPPKKKFPPVFFHITTLQPQWRETGSNTADNATHGETIFSANWSYGIPQKWWCFIRSAFHEYVVCGRITDCESKVPLKGLKISGFDYDLIQDDPLGFAITDADGKYKLHYSEADFSKTIFNWLNVEWPAGPDLYFKIETATGDVLLQEDRNTGRQAGRSNAPHCVCIDFCVNFKPNVNYAPALFTHVGQYAIATDFDGSGYTNDSERNAFTQSIPLVGVLPGGIASNAMEYRFKIKNLDTSVETILDAAHMNAFQIGTLNTLHFSPFSYTTQPYYVNNPGGTFNVVMAADGWIKVPRENDLFGTGQFSAGTLLGSLNTEWFTKEFFDLTVPSIYKAGDAFPAGQKAGIHTFQISFEAREVGSSTVAYSTVLQKIIFSNVTYSQIVHPSWAGGLRAKIGVGMLEIAETTATGAGCNKVDDTLTANYSVVHPHLETVTISFEGNAPLPADFSPAFSGTGESVGAHSFTDLNSLPMKPCAYIIHLVGAIRLTSGGGRLSWAYVEDHIAFCKS